MKNRLLLITLFAIIACSCALMSSAHNKLTSSAQLSLLQKQTARHRRNRRAAILRQRTRIVIRLISQTVITQPASQTAMHHPRSRKVSHLRSQMARCRHRATEKHRAAKHQVDSHLRCRMEIPQTVKHRAASHRRCLMVRHQAVHRVACLDRAMARIQPIMITAVT